MMLKPDTTYGSSISKHGMVIDVLMTSGYPLVNRISFGIVRQLTSWSLFTDGGGWRAKPGACVVHPGKAFAPKKPSRHERRFFPTRLPKPGVSLGRRGCPSRPFRQSMSGIFLYAAGRAADFG